MGRSHSKQDNNNQIIKPIKMNLNSNNSNNNRNSSLIGINGSNSHLNSTKLTDPSIILEPFLYLGSAYGNRNVNLLDYLGITHVLNMACELPMNRELYSDRFKFIHILAEDSYNYNIRKDFELAFQFIDDARASGGKVLVHCMMGISRSATIVIAYLMNRYAMSLSDAYRYCKLLRPEIGPNNHFMKILEYYEYELHGFRATHRIS